MRHPSLDFLPGTETFFYRQHDSSEEADVPRITLIRAVYLYLLSLIGIVLVLFGAKR